MLKNISMVFLADGLSKSLNFVAMFYIIQSLSPDEFSKFTILITLIFLGYQCACALIERLYISDYEAYKNNFYLYSCCIVSVTCLVALCFSFYKGGFEYGVLFFLGFLFLAIFQIKRIIYQRNQNFRMFSVLEFVRVGLFTLMVLLFINAEVKSYGYFVFSLGLSAIISCLIFSDVKVKRNYEFEVAEVKSVYDYFMPKYKLIAYSFLSGVVPYMAVLTVSQIGSDLDLAQYGVAVRFSAILGMAVYALNVVSLPVITASKVNDVTLVIKKFLRNAFWIIFGLAVIVLAIGWVMKQTLEPHYNDSVFIFYILSVCSVASFMSAPFANVLLKSKRYDLLLKGLFLGFGVFFISIVVLIDIAGSYVSACSAAICYAVLAVYLIFCGVKYNEDPDC